MELWRRLALDPAAHRLVTLVGGGGKTTLLYALARQAVDAGYTVAVTTTTHILPIPGSRGPNGPPGPCWRPGGR